MGDECRETKVEASFAHLTGTIYRKDAVDYQTSMDHSFIVTTLDNLSIRCQQHSDADSHTVLR